MAHEMKLMDESVGRRVAHIIGSSGSMQAALDELERRRANGEDVRLFTLGNTVLVGPPLSQPQHEGKA